MATKFRIIKYACGYNYSAPFNATGASYSSEYKMFIINAPSTINFYGVYERGVINVTAGNQITFKNGFQAKAGSILKASIQPCSSLESLTLKEDSIQTNSIDSIDKNIVLLNNEKSLHPISKLSIYPNPNKGMFNIDMQNLKEKVNRIEIYNSGGRIQKSITNGFSEVEFIDIENAPTDIYLIKIITISNIYYLKVVKL